MRGPVLPGRVLPEGSIPTVTPSQFLMACGGPLERASVAPKPRATPAAVSPEMLHTLREAGYSVKAGPKGHALTKGKRKLGEPFKSEAEAWAHALGLAFPS